MSNPTSSDDTDTPPAALVSSPETDASYPSSPPTNFSPPPPHSPIVSMIETEAVFILSDDEECDEIEFVVSNDYEDSDIEGSDVEILELSEGQAVQRNRRAIDRAKKRNNPPKSNHGMMTRLKAQVVDLTNEPNVEYHTDVNSSSLGAQNNPQNVVDLTKTTDGPNGSDDEKDDNEPSSKRVQHSMLDNEDAGLLLGLSKALDVYPLSHNEIGSLFENIIEKIDTRQLDTESMPLTHGQRAPPGVIIRSLENIPKKDKNGVPGGASKRDSELVIRSRGSEFACLNDPVEKKEITAFEALCIYKLFSSEKYTAMLYTTIRKNKTPGLHPPIVQMFLVCAPVGDEFKNGQPYNEYFLASMQTSGQFALALEDLVSTMSKTVYQEYSQAQVTYGRRIMKTFFDGAVNNYVGYEYICC